MLAFVTSLRHPQNSSDYRRVESLLRETLDSITGQTRSDFVVIVVGNREPSFRLPPKTVFVPVAFEAPAPPNGPRTDRTSFVWDKGTKIGAGLLAAREYAPTHVMIFDADDYVSNQLADFVSSRDGNAAWVLRSGWMYSHTREVIKPIDRFNKTCGTSFIVPFEAYAVPASLSPQSSQTAIADGFGDTLPNVLGAHRDAEEWFTSHGLEVLPLPFRGAVYNVDTGENHSGKSFRGLARPVSSPLIRQFGLPVRRSRANRLWEAIGPRAAVETFRSRLRLFRG
ncbi:hypothetical protein [Microbacterium oleivorans]|uniref:hypothetical protein n=1 Tax=Microbacterium oleivorans TaxID=273677 RepID=UPI00203E64E4|nr:hypothetical protein [Microbacterium oleivorans]MCM3697155.1 hypothetical protein [Microbacterium oleivorans]